MTRRKEPDLEIAIEEITPAIASEWLKTNTRNRRVSERLVTTYAEAMSEGEWRLNGEPIVFDRQGRLQSGQHRLLAVIQSDVSIKSTVVRNADPEALFSLDSGRRRRMSDVLQLRGETDTMTLGAMLVWTWRWQNGLMDRPGDTPTHTSLLRILDQEPDLREDLTAGRNIGKKMRCSTALLGALYHQFKLIDPDDADSFFESLASGENLHQGEPLFALRRWMINATQMTHRPRVHHYAAIIVKAWNAYRTHDTMRTVTWRAGETFPEAL